MTTVLDYTRKLLYEHDCVVLPDLGGFLAYFSHAFYSEQNATFHPPQKRVAFNEALKLDDGLLAHYLTVNEQISREDAQKRIHQYVDTIKNAIKEKGSFTLEGIGALETNAEGKLQFEPMPVSNFYAEGYGLKSLQVSAVKPTVEIDISESSADWTATDRAPEELVVEVPRRRSRVALYVGGALLIGSALVGGLTQFPSESLKSSLNPFELLTTIKEKLTVDSKPNTVKEIVTVPAKKIDKAIEPEAVKVEVVEPTPAIVVKEVIAEKPTIKIPTKVVVASKVAEVTPSVSLKSDENAEYMVIAGGFSKLDNARNLETKLKRNGYENATILNPTPAQGGLIIVTAIGCDDINKAKAQIARVSRLADANAYVTRK